MSLVSSTQTVKPKTHAPVKAHVMQNLILLLSDLAAQVLLIEGLGQINRASQILLKQIMVLNDSRKQILPAICYQNS